MTEATSDVDLVHGGWKEGRVFNDLDGDLCPVEDQVLSVEEDSPVPEVIGAIHGSCASFAKRCSYMIS